MKLEFDPYKSLLNELKRELPFSLVAQFDFVTALYQLDDRRDYGETRVRALGFISQRLYALVFKETSFGIRVISLRKANMREVRFYEQKTAQQKHH
jgi:hypothetical protein|tara:strand:+ start:183 stop:470 length:288 start_codon:yes stop_codon:yes gene_type:complete